VSRRPRPGSLSRPLLYVTILLLLIVSVGLVIASPLALEALGAGGRVDWGRLSEIGQTYGAVSAIIAAVALLGVMVSLVIQAREAKSARQAAQRGHLLDLLRMAMDDPRYMECWGPYLTDSFTAEGQFAYVNLIVAHWHAEYEVGEMADALLKATAASVFASAPGRGYWRNAGTFWRDNYSGRRARRFHRVLEDAYREAIKKPPSTPPVSVESESLPVPRWRVTVLAAGGGVAAVLLVIRAVRRALRGH
jgi:hypothetical protein